MRCFRKKMAGKLWPAFAGQGREAGWPRAARELDQGEWTSGTAIGDAVIPRWSEGLANGPALRSVTSLSAAHAGAGRPGPGPAPRARACPAANWQPARSVASVWIFDVHDASGSSQPQQEVKRPGGRNPSLQLLVNGQRCPLLRRIRDQRSKLLRIRQFSLEHKGQAVWSYCSNLQQNLAYLPLIQTILCLQRKNQVLLHPQRTQAMSHTTCSID
jgi:hypothetical protein